MIIIFERKNKHTYNFLKLVGAYQLILTLVAQKKIQVRDERVYPVYFQENSHLCSFEIRVLNLTRRQN